FAHIVPGDEDPTTALKPPGALSQNTLDDDSDDMAPMRGRSISDSLRPFMQGPLREHRKVVIGVGAALAASLLFFSVKALVRDDPAEQLAQRETARSEEVVATGSHAAEPPPVV